MSRDYGPKGSGALNLTMVTLNPVTTRRMAAHQYQRASMSKLPLRMSVEMGNFQTAFAQKIHSAP